jgi:D-glycero-D-manno-heptose 1,7-bisphosphate phosphatase
MKLIFSEPHSYSGSQAIFLDRDGVINQRVVGDYVRHWRNFLFLPGVQHAINALATLPVPIIVVSNQAGVAKGAVTERDLRDLTIAFQQELALNGARIDAVYYCVHHPDEGCDCRKPRSGLLLQAAQEWGLNLNDCFMVGDSASDIIAGASVGCQTILVNRSSDSSASVRGLGCTIVDDLRAASARLLKKMIMGGPFRASHPLALPTSIARQRGSMTSD